MKWYDIVLKFLPGILGLIKPTLGPIGGGIALAVNEAEQIWGPGTGAQKLAHVLNAAAAAAATVNLAEGRTVIDPTTLGETVAAGIQVGIGVINLLSKMANTPGGPIAP